MKAVKVGIVGCGNISGIYFQAGQKFDILDVVACADVDRARAEAKAKEHGVTALTVEDLLASPEVDVVINLTIPAAHYEICRLALENGKHTYTEKPLSLTREEGKALLDLAASRGLRVGGAPDTFLGAGLQTCREVIDRGDIGEPVGASGLRQVIDIVVQLQGRAGPRQVAGAPRTGFTHVYGAPGISACTVLTA